MEIECKEINEVNDGSHNGTITGVSYRSEPYQYTDVHIKMANNELTLKVGYSTFITKNSKLGRLLEKFGAVIEVGKKLDPNKVLIGKQCKFVTVKNGIYANIQPDSVCPR